MPALATASLRAPMTLARCVEEPPAPVSRTDASSIPPCVNLLDATDEQIAFRNPSPLECQRMLPFPGVRTPQSLSEMLGWEAKGIVVRRSPLTATICGRRNALRANISEGQGMFFGKKEEDVQRLNLEAPKPETIRLPRAGESGDSTRRRSRKARGSQS